MSMIILNVLPAVLACRSAIHRVLAAHALLAATIPAGVALAA